MGTPQRDAGAQARLPGRLVLSYKGLSPDSELLDLVAEGIVSGVVIFRDNAVNVESLRESITRLRARAPGPFRVMVDEEGGRVSRLPTGAASMNDLRSYRSVGSAAVAAAYVRTAERLKELGIDTLLAPVVDLGRSESGWLRSRTWSDDPDEVATMARAVISGVQRAGVDCCAKHFPGSGGVSGDPHTGPADDATPPSVWEKADAVPFRAAIAAGVRLIMVGHQRLAGFDALRPACLSPVIIQVLLQERLGFRGLVATDDLAMGAIVQRYPIETAVSAALDGGCDLVLVCNDRALQRRAVAAGRDQAARARKMAE